MSIASSVTTARANLSDLAKTPGKAELIGGRVVPLMPTGFKPSRVAARIFRSLDDPAEVTGRGFAFTDNLGYAVRELRSGRESFSPDVSYYVGPPPSDEMDFLSGAPTLAVEVRSKSDYGASAESEMAAKRADYFEAGTPIVWDVDLKAKVVRVYLAGSLEPPIVFESGQEAHAEPAVPDWRIAVDLIFA